MKSARIITRISKNAKDIAVPVTKRKTPAKSSLLEASAKISAQAQFLRIKEALKEVELIEAGIVKPISLKEALNDL